MTEHIEKIQALISRFDKETLKILQEITVTEQLKKGDILLQQGEICRKSSLIVDGVARKFIYTDKKEVTSEFFFKDDIAFPLKAISIKSQAKKSLNVLLTLQ